MRSEHRGDVSVRPMDLVDQLRDSRRHHEEVLRFRLACVPVGVGRSSSSQHGRPGIRMELIVAESEAESAGEDVPRLVVPIMDVQRRDPMVADLGSPLNENEVVVR